MSITPRDRNGRCRACGKPAEAVHHVRGCLFESTDPRTRPWPSATVPTTRETPGLVGSALQDAGELPPGFDSPEERARWERLTPFVRYIAGGPSYHYHLSHESDEPHTDHVHVAPSEVLRTVARDAPRRPVDAYTMERFRDQLSAANDVLAQTIYPNPYLVLHTEEGGPNAGGIVGNQPKEEPVDSFAKAERRRQADVRVQEAQERAAKATAKFKAAEERADKWEGRAEVAETELRKARAERERLDWPAEPTTRPRVHAQAGYEVGDLGPLVVSFQRRLGGHNYTYAAVGVAHSVSQARVWYVTGNRDHRGQGMAWETLMEWIGEHGRRTLVKATSLQRVAR